MSYRGHNVLTSSQNLITYYLYYREGTRVKKSYRWSPVISHQAFRLVVQPWGHPQKPSQKQGARNPEELSSTLKDTS